MDGMSRRDLFSALTAIAGVAAVSGASGRSADAASEVSKEKANPAFHSDPMPEETVKDYEAKIKIQDGKQKLVTDEEALKLTHGSSPLTRDTVAWEEIKSKFAVLFPTLAKVPMEDLLTHRLDSTVLQIDEGYAFVKKADDEQFSLFHLEQLLNQAADLLDRALQLRDEWNDKATKSFGIALDILEYISIDKIHEEEIKNGFYTLPYRQSRAEHSADTASSYAQQEAALSIRSLLNSEYTPERLRNLSEAQRLIAWLSHIPGYQYPFVGQPLMNEWNGKPDTNAKHAMNAMQVISWHATYTELALLRLQVENYEMAQRVSEWKAAASDVRSSWDREDIEFRRARTETARKLGDLKVKATTEIGGALNLAEQMSKLKVRFDRDFRDALARIVPALRGMELVYGYTTVLPFSLDISKSEDNAHSSGYFENALVTVRDAISWLDAFSQRDQNYVLSLSLKTFLTQERWEKGEKKGFWTLELTERQFPTQCHIRLRGLSLSVIADGSIFSKTSSLWHAEVRVPHASYVRHLSNKVVNLDQSTVPPCWIGRVKSRNASQDPDVVGISALHNVSPLGTWQIKIMPADTKNIGDIEDVYLDLHLAVRHQSQSNPMRET